jgi:adenylate kinase family enzyme
MALYRQQSAPILDFYRERGLLFEIDVTDVHMADVTARIEEAIG